MVVSVFNMKICIMENQKMILNWDSKISGIYAWENNNHKNMLSEKLIIFIFS